MLLGAPAGVFVIGGAGEFGRGDRGEVAITVENFDRGCRPGLGDHYFLGNVLCCARACGRRFVGVANSGNKPLGLGSAGRWVRARDHRRLNWAREAWQSGGFGNSGLIRWFWASKNGPYSWWLTNIWRRQACDLKGTRRQGGHYGTLGFSGRHNDPDGACGLAILYVDLRYRDRLRWPKSVARSSR